MRMVHSRTAFVSIALFLVMAITISSAPLDNKDLTTEGPRQPSHGDLMPVTDEPKKWDINHKQPATEESKKSEDIHKESAPEKREDGVTQSSEVQQKSGQDPQQPITTANSHKKTIKDKKDKKDKKKNKNKKKNKKGEKTPDDHHESNGLPDDQDEGHKKKKDHNKKPGKDHKIKKDHNKKSDGDHKIKKDHNKKPDEDHEIKEDHNKKHDEGHKKNNHHRKKPVDDSSTPELDHEDIPAETRRKREDDRKESADKPNKPAEDHKEPEKPSADGSTTTVIPDTISSTLLDHNSNLNPINTDDKKASISDFNNNGPEIDYPKFHDQKSSQVLFN